MFFIKCILIFGVFIISATIGNIFSKKYTSRESQLEEIKTMLNIFKAKIKFNSVPIQDIFHQIYIENQDPVGEIFEYANKKMNTVSASEAWNLAIQEKVKNTNLTLQDKSALQTLGKMLGSMDIEGQVSQIDLTEQLIENQLIEAEQAKKKNVKLCRTLGTATGLTIAIILL